MLSALSKVFALSLVAFACLFTLFSFVCYLLDHDQLVMLHMYFTPIIISLTYGVIVQSISVDRRENNTKEPLAG